MKAVPEGLERRGPALSPFPCLPVNLLQDAIMEAVREGVGRRLLAANSTRCFTQMQLPFAPTVPGVYLCVWGGGGHGSP